MGRGLHRLLRVITAISELQQLTKTLLYSIMAQVYVVVAAGSVIAFIGRDLGDIAIGGWIIEVMISFISTDVII
jgi:hypothetical protein